MIVRWAWVEDMEQSYRSDESFASLGQQVDAACINSGAEEIRASIVWATGIRYVTQKRVLR